MNEESFYEIKIFKLELLLATTVANVLTLIPVSLKVTPLL